jgi:serine/threonine protein kinase
MEPLHGVPDCCSLSIGLLSRSFFDAVNVDGMVKVRTADVSSASTGLPTSEQPSTASVLTMCMGFAAVTDAQKPQLCVLVGDDEPFQPAGEYDPIDRFAGSPIASPKSRGVAAASFRSTTNTSGASQRNALSCIGFGATSSVHIVYNETLTCDVAEKRIKMTQERTQFAFAEIGFAERAIAMAEGPDVGPRVWHHIVEIHEATHNEESNDTIVVMEFLPGGSVADIAEFRSPYTPMPRRLEPKELLSVSGSKLLDVIDINEVSDGDSDDDCLEMPVAIFQSAGDDYVASVPTRDILLPRYGSQINDEARSPERRLKQVANDALTGLLMMHEILLVIHRDVKPDNLLVASDGSTKLVDFGSSALLSARGEKVSDQAGTFAYMSPERLRGEAHGPKSDVWSIGVTLLQLLGRGRHPFIELTNSTTNQRETFWAIAAALGVTSNTCTETIQRAVQTALAAIEPPPSPAFCDFIYCALEPNPEARTSVEDLLQHPWLCPRHVPPVHL